MNKKITLHNAVRLISGLVLMSSLYACGGDSAPAAATTPPATSCVLGTSTLDNCTL
ncbi:MAG: hypothetical protein OEY06_12660 [Gammaproteobacteria bacterium]|nr:hypothetical protein [Gammaproteobacteria bacterium]